MRDKERREKQEERKVRKATTEIEKEEIENKSKD